VRVQDLPGARELPLATKSLELWDRFAADSGEDTGFSRCGLLYLSNNEAELAGERISPKAKGAKKP